jgi:hypothetical protein
MIERIKKTSELWQEERVANRLSAVLSTCVVPSSGNYLTRI